LNSLHAVLLLLLNVVVSVDTAHVRVPLFRWQLPVGFRRGVSSEEYVLLVGLSGLELLLLHVHRAWRVSYQVSAISFLWSSNEDSVGLITSIYSIASY
jgi:hypothetical protein